MSKALPLIRRLEIALTETSSNSEKEIIFANTYRLINSLRFQGLLDIDSFYQNINHETLYLRTGDYRKEEIEKGELIVKLLEDAIPLPTKGGIVRDYRGKMIAAMEKEFEVLKEIKNNPDYF